MEKNTEFVNLLNELHNDDYVGLGNPNAKILFIGKEAGLPKDKKNELGLVNSYKKDFQNHSKRFFPENRDIYSLNHTWQKNQKLYSEILQNLGISDIGIDRVKREITFVENVFTTELNTHHAKTSAEAKRHKDFKSSLEKRKQTFFKSNFIKSFPIVIIFAIDNKYIECYHGEVQELFEVEYKDEIAFENKSKIWIHSQQAENPSPKLLIHTRQLTNGASNELIEKLGELIADFIKENSIDIIVKK